MLQEAGYRRSNALLSGLSEPAANALLPHLETVSLPRGRSLQRQGRLIDFVYFIDDGVACVVSDGRGVGSVQVAIVGREGFVSFDRALGATHAQYETIMFVPGTGRRIPAHLFDAAFEESSEVRRRTLRCVCALTTQMMSTAGANARMTLDQRLTRLLLMLHDRIDGDEIRLTHDCLSGLLGVRRAGVSVAAKKLEQAGIIATHRGAVLVTDRAKLEAICRGGYGPRERDGFDRSATSRGDST